MKISKFKDLSLTIKGILFHYTFLRKSQFFSETDIYTHQKNLLQDLMIHCKQNISWYTKAFRKYDIDPYNEDIFKEFYKLPVLTKNEVRESQSDFTLTGAAGKGLLFSTSGTTGEPFSVFTSPKQWINEQGVIWRHWSWAGYKFRDKIAIFRSYSPAKGMPKIKKDYLRNWSYFSVFDMDKESIDEYAKYLIKWNPKYLRGYPSALLLICDHAIQNNWTLDGLKGAFTASEVVTEELREKLKLAFNIEVFDHYGQAEITCMLHECDSHKGMHVDWEYGHVDFIETGEPNIYKLVATNLHNYYTPLLRYDTGDMVLGPIETCTCGRTSPVVKSIFGRQDQYLIMHDGSKASTVNLYTYFSNKENIQRFQMSQKKPGELQIKINPWKKMNLEEEKIFSKSIKLDLEKHSRLKIDIEMTDEFILSLEGKFSSFIQKCEL